MVWDDLVAEWFSRSLPEITPRRVHTRNLPGKADAVIGMRRAGKSWLLLGEISAARRAGAPEGSILYVSLEDDRLTGVDVTDLAGLLEAWYRRHPEAARGPGWLILDEVQVVPGWERFVRRVLDGGITRIAVTGSSARLLSKEIATAMRGRSLPVEVLPFGFDEWLAHRGIATPARWPPGPAERAVLVHAFDRYLDVGGFPEVAGRTDGDRRAILRDYVDVVLLRDVLERHAATNLPALRRLVTRFVSTPGSSFSVHKFHNDLRSQGIAIGKDALYASVDHVEDAYLGFRVAIRSESERVRATNPVKLYPIDPGLARAFATRAEVGHLLEDAVYLELRRRGGEITWLRTRQGFEVDFAIDHADGLGLVQVCADWSDPVTRARELRALEAAMQELGVEEARVVTLVDTGEELGGRVRVVPAWEWVLRSGLR